MANNEEFSVFYQNVRGLRTKCADFYQAVLEANSDCICITETWLRKEILSCELFPPGYNVFRLDRDPSVSGRSDGGGVLVAIRESLSVECLQHWCNVNNIIEDLWVSVELKGGKKLFLCCIYIPPHATVNNFIAFFSKIEDFISKHKNNDFILIGDFNLSGTEWGKINADSAHVVPLNIPDLRSQCFCDCITMNNFKQFNQITNSNEKILDLVLCNSCSMSVGRSGFPLVPEDAHHPSLEIHVNLTVTRGLVSGPYTKILFSDANYDLINVLIDQYDWNTILQSENVNDNVNVFYNILRSIIDSNIPKKQINKSTYPIWFSRYTKYVIRQKNTAHKKWKTYKNQSDYNTFSILRRKVKASIRSDFKNYITLTENNLKTDTKHFWSFVNNRRNTKSLPNNMHLDNTYATNSREICDLFSKFFVSVYEPRDTPSLVGSCQSDAFLTMTLISEEDVESVLRDLPVNRGAGPDGLPSLFLKSCPSLCRPLTIIYNQCISMGLFPEAWKVAQIVPIHKSGSRDNVGNYRPISLLNHFGKMFEVIILQQLFFRVKNAIDSNQHGFFRGRSIITNLVPFIQQVNSNMEVGLDTCAVYTDFSKAFDKIHHATLLVKLENFGVHGSLLRLLDSYLTDRSFYVAVNGERSDSAVITSGVPQGSHLGPLLFSIFLNDVSQCFRDSSYCLYADDLKMYKAVGSPSDMVSLQDDLSRFSDYCTLNRLYLNIDKCQTIIFSKKNVLPPYLTNVYINGSVVASVDSIKDLGVILDSKLLFEKHIEGIVQRAFRSLGFILRMSQGFQNSQSLILLYQSLVRPILEYATPAWNPMYHKYITRLEAVQRKFINILNYKFNRQRHFLAYSLNLSYYRMQGLESRRKYFDILLLYKIVNNLLDCKYCIEFLSFNAGSYSLRHRMTFYTDRFHSNYYSNSPLIRCQRTYNALCHNEDLDMFVCNLTRFKKLVRNYLS